MFRRTKPLGFLKPNPLSECSPVKLRQFADELEKWLKPHPMPSKFGKVGIAVSGGVDSMALAHLCARLRDSNTWRKSAFTPHAFVVDHGARPESEHESIRVVAALKKMGIPARRIPLEWPDGVTDPSKLSNFETQARRLRYQALGMACAEEGIRTLLLGHHQDDLAESVLMRIIDYRGPSGLRGPRHFARIPECTGIPGVDDLIYQTEPTIRSPKPVWKSTRGVTICRPLLAFSKSRLEATCTASATPWFEDRTNHDPTVTMRNAVRHLLASGRLPQALQGPRLLQLSETVRKRLIHDNFLANKTLEHLQANHRTARTSMRVFIPLDDHAPPSSPLNHSGMADFLQSHPAVAGRLIQKLVRRITPHSILSERQKSDTHRILTQALSMQPMVRASLSRQDLIVRFSVQHTVWEVRRVRRANGAGGRRSEVVGLEWVIAHNMMSWPQRRANAIGWTSEDVSASTPAWRLANDTTWVAVTRWDARAAHFRAAEAACVERPLASRLLKAQQLDPGDWKYFLRRYKDEQRWDLTRLRKGVEDDVLLANTHRRRPRLGIMMVGAPQGVRVLALTAPKFFMPGLQETLEFETVPKYIDPLLDEEDD